MKKFKGVKEFSVVLLCGIATAIISYLVNLLLLRVYSDEHYGILSKALIWSGLISVFVTYETNGIAQKLYVSFNNSVLPTLKSVHSVRAINFFIVLLASVLASNFYDSKFLCVILVYLIPTFNFSYLFETQSENEFYAIIFCIERVLYGGIAYVLTNYFHGILDVVLYSIAFSAIISLIVQSLIINCKHIEHKNNVKLQIKKIYVENFIFVINAYAMFTFGNISKLMLEPKIGLAGLGLYNFCWQIVSLSTLFSTILQKLIRLKIHQYAREKKLNSIKYEYLKILTLGIALTILTNLVLLFGGEYILMMMNRQGKTEILNVLHIFSVFFLVTSVDAINEILSIEYRFKFSVFLNMFFGFLMIIWIYFSANSTIEYYATAVTCVQFFATFIVTITIAIKLAKIHKL